MAKNTSDMIYFLQEARIEILKRLKDNFLDNTQYLEIIRHLNSPKTNKIIKFNENEISNLNKLDNKNLINLCIFRLFQFYRYDKKEFNRICREGQYIVWSNVFRCAENLIDIKNALNNLNYGLRPNDYFGSCTVVKEHLNLLANGYKEMVLFEKRMGVDRYLATSGLSNDIEILHEILREIRDICNYKLKDFIKIFQTKWNLTSVSKAINRSLDFDIEDNEISNSMIRNQDRVIYLLLDGFGYTQYLWLLSGLRERKSITFGINLFEWLKSKDE